MANTPFVQRIAAAAAHIATEQPGFALPDFEDVAEHLLANMVGPRYGRGEAGLYRQDVDYLARTLQAIATGCA